MGLAGAVNSGTKMANEGVPRAVAALASIVVVQVAAGFSHSMALAADGGEWSWGSGGAAANLVKPEHFPATCLENGIAVALELLQHLRRAVGVRQSLVLDRLEFLDDVLAFFAARHASFTQPISLPMSGRSLSLACPIHKKIQSANQIRNPLRRNHKGPGAGAARSWRSRRQGPCYLCLSSKKLF